MNVFRNHWKKCTFAALLSGYGIYSAHVSIQISAHMRELCNQIASEQHNIQPPRRLVVVVNPTANKNKSEKMFKKYCEPLLHLGGFSVEIVKTTHSGHVKNLIENLESLPDAIVVAGGDGIILESVTGLLRRTDTPCPIVILPLGRRNETAWKLLNYEPHNKLELVKALSHSVLPLIQNKIRYANVMKYEVVDDSGEKSDKDLKPIYGLNKFSWGLLREMDSIKDKYWYFGPMRWYSGALFNAFSNKINWKVSADYMYTAPCAGCRNCFVERKNKPESRGFLGSMFYKPDDNKRGNKRLYVENENCKQKMNGHLEGNQIDVVCETNSENIPELKASTINSIEPGLKFISSIPDIRKNKLEPSLVIESRTLEIKPECEEGKEAFYAIDGEQYDVRPIKIAILPNMIPIFA